MKSPCSAEVQARPSTFLQSRRKRFSTSAASVKRAGIGRDRHGLDHAAGLDVLPLLPRVGRVAGRRRRSPPCAALVRAQIEGPPALSGEAGEARIGGSRGRIVGEDRVTTRIAGAERRGGPGRDEGERRRRGDERGAHGVLQKLSRPRRRPRAPWRGAAASAAPAATARWATMTAGVSSAAASCSSSTEGARRRSSRSRRRAP